jgi:predicted flap endonuclease-1-like 5' DNA nuclease
MATKDSNTTMINKTEDTIKKVSAKVHEELLNTSILFIDETVATLTRMQKITGKVIKKSEPIIEKQIEFTFDAVEAIKDQAGKGGKRALKLLGLTKQYNKLSETIADKVKEIPSPEEMIENAKEMVATAKTDVEETINKASDSIKSVTNFGEAEVAKKAKKIEKIVVAKTKAAKTVAKKVATKVTTNAKTAAKKTSKVVTTAKKTTPVTKKVTTPVAKKVTPVAKKVTPVAKKIATPVTKKVTTPVAKKVTPVAKKATATALTSELTKINGIGQSLAMIMTDNGIKTIKDLQEATPTALKIIATKAGNRYKSFDTNNWITAAKATK